MTLAARFGTEALFYRWVLVVLPALCLASPVALADSMASACPESAVRIYVDDIGIIKVNGAVIPTERVKETLASLKPKPTAVCFAPAHPPLAPREAVAALDAGVALQVPIYFFEDGDFRVPLRLPSNNRWRGP